MKKVFLAFVLVLGSSAVFAQTEKDSTDIQVPQQEEKSKLVEDIQPDSTITKEDIKLALQSTETDSTAVEKPTTELFVQCTKKDTAEVKVEEKAELACNKEDIEEKTEGEDPKKAELIAQAGETEQPTEQPVEKKDIEEKTEKAQLACNKEATEEKTEGEDPKKSELIAQAEEAEQPTEQPVEKKDIEEKTEKAELV
jgi:hypothetical protein